MRKNILLIFASILLTGCVPSSQTKETYEISPVEVPVEHDYSEVSGFHIQWSTIFSQKPQTYYVYFYSLNCSHCANLKNTIIEKALKRNDIFFVRASNNDKLSNDVKNTIGVGFADDFSILGYPSMAKIVDRKVEKNVAGKSQILGLLN